MTSTLQVPDDSAIGIAGENTPAECVSVIFATKDSKPETCRNMQNIPKSLV